MLNLELSDRTRVATVQTGTVQRAEVGWRVFVGPVAAAEAVEATLASQRGELMIVFGDHRYPVTIEEPRSVNLAGGPVTLQGRFAVPDEPEV